jgi:HEAT repeat protein
MNFFSTDEATHIETGYSEQPERALSGNDTYAAMRVLAQALRGKTKIPASDVIPLARSDSILLRRMALQTLAKSKDRSVISVLERSLNDPERSVRAAAALALGEMRVPDTVRNLINTVRRVREFQIFEAAATALVSVDGNLSEITQAADDRDTLIRRLALYVLGRKGAPEGLSALIAGLGDPDLFARFYAAHGLQSYGNYPEAVEALVRTVRNSDPIVQDRAAVSLAIATVPDSTLEPRIGLESAIRILATPIGPLRALTLDVQQGRALDVLVELFRQFGDSSHRTDPDWGFRPVGNAILAFGTEGGRRLQAMVEQQSDRRLAELAWQVLYIRQGMENFCPLSEPDQEMQQIARSHPTKPAIPEAQGRRYSPFDK